MPNLFEVLSLPCGLSISSEEVDAAWRRLSQEFHPDLIGEEGVDISANLNEAREKLSKPGGCLSEWLTVNGGESPSRNTALSEDLMSLFSSVGDVLREADLTIDSLKKAQTALAKSLLMPKAIATQLAIQKQLGEITAKIEVLRLRFPDFESAGENGDFREANAVAGELKFLDKWQRECQQRLLELISMG